MNGPREHKLIRPLVALVVWGALTIGLFMAGSIEPPRGTLFAFLGWISLLSVVIGSCWILWELGKSRFPLAFEIAEVALAFSAYIFTAAMLGLFIYMAMDTVPTYLVILANVIKPLNEAQLQVLGWSIVLTAFFCVLLYYASQALLHLWERFPRFAAGFWGLYFIGSAEYLVRTRSEVIGAIAALVFGILLMLIASARFKKYEEAVKESFSQFRADLSLSAKKS